MAIIALDHMQMAMPIGEENRARQFYCGILGMIEVPKPAPMAARGGVWFRAGSVNLHMGVQLDFIPAKKAHPAFIVNNFAALIASLTSANYPVKQDFELEKVNRLFTQDCFGNRIEIIEGNSPKFAKAIP
ncbi:MAG: hypothetical protein FD163_1017 [Hyphomonadaceae bacterium]|nr:MAG: hypothetical protein FD128_1790 [Hyphomonadaceae bacterium]KAF0186349.1 MAG: hypothetical protein FD163_1017 [Hyphomonadaceae bacterium]